MIFTTYFWFCSANYDDLTSYRLHKAFQGPFTVSTAVMWIPCSRDVTLPVRKIKNKGKEKKKKKKNSTKQTTIDNN